MRKLLCALTLCGAAHLSHAAGDDDQATHYAASARNYLSGKAMAAEERSSSVTAHDRPYHITRGIVAAAQAVTTDKDSLTEAERKAAYQLWLLFGKSASMAEALVIAKNLKIQDETAFG